jgi:hypothetical protein
MFAAQYLGHLGRQAAQHLFRRVYDVPFADDGGRSGRVCFCTDHAREGLLVIKENTTKPPDFVYNGDRFSKLKETAPGRRG